MADKYADLRAALDAVPCVKWTASRSTVHIPEAEDWAGKGLSITGLDKQVARKLARYIADTHPVAIRALLAERDDVLENGKQAVRWAPSSAHWSNELKRLFGEDAREGIDALEAQLRAAQAERDAMKEVLEQALIWHESQDKAISKQPNANIGSKGFMRLEHQEQAEIIRAALAQEQGGSDG